MRPVSRAPSCLPSHCWRSSYSFASKMFPRKGWRGGGGSIPILPCSLRIGPCCQSPKHAACRVLTVSCVSHWLPIFHFHTPHSHRGHQSPRRTPHSPYEGGAGIATGYTGYAGGRAWPGYLEGLEIAGGGAHTCTELGRSRCSITFPGCRSLCTTPAE